MRAVAEHLPKTIPEEGLKIVVEKTYAADAYNSYNTPGCFKYFQF